MPDAPLPTIGRIVIYRSRTGNYSIPAVVNCTVDTIYQPGVDGGFVPALSGAAHVHLNVFTPGVPGLRKDADDFIGERADAPRAENMGGTYQEWDVSFDPDGAPGTWSWPQRV